MSHPATIEIGGKRVGQGSPTFLIAEIGSNHNRDTDLARRLIDAAAESGWDAVKFQLFRAAWLYPSNCGLVETASGAVDFFEVLQKAELPEDWLPPLKQHAEERGLVFLCTPFDESGVDSLAQLHVAALKIASPELNHIPLLQKAGATGLPLICSTGLSTLADIEEALSSISAVRVDAAVAILQCVTAYPVPAEESNLGVIRTLAQAFGVPIGLSDHSMEPESVPAIATAVGGALLEKHVTLDRHLPGPDHAFAIEPAEMRALVQAVRQLDQLPFAERLPFVERAYGRERVQAIIGHGRKEIMPSEAPLYPCDKRSIHAIRPIVAGTTLTPENARIVRSERNLRPGLHPRHWRDVLGAKVVSDIDLGEGIRWEHLLSR